MTISATSRRGPFAGDRLLAVRPHRFALVNTGSEPVSCHQIVLDPLREEDGGAATWANLTVRWQGAPPEPVEIAPGAAAVLVISGTLPARANTYVTTLRVRPQAGELLTIATTAKVGARAAWGISLMLLGLCLLGVLSTLGAEGSVQNRLRKILTFRQEIHESLEKKPPPESLVQDEVALDGELAAAIAALRTRRPVSFVDRRIDEDDERWDAARPLADRLRKAQDEKKSGQIQVESLRGEGAALQMHFDRLT